MTTTVGPIPSVASNGALAVVLAPVSVFRRCVRLSSIPCVAATTKPTTTRASLRPAEYRWPLMEAAQVSQLSGFDFYPSSTRSSSAHTAGVACTSASECAEDQYCHFPLATCGGSGFCAYLPQVDNPPADQLCLSIQGALTCVFPPGVQSGEPSGLWVR